MLMNHRFEHMLRLIIVTEEGSVKEYLLEEETVWVTSGLASED